MPSKKQVVKIYYQDADGELCHSEMSKGPRIRIIHPDGLCEWMPLSAPPLQLARYFFGDMGNFKVPCWAEEGSSNKEIEGLTQAKAIRLMHEYDRNENWKRAILIAKI